MDSRSPEYMREYRIKNKDRINENKRRWRKEKREKHLAWQREYRERNREKLREWHREAARKNPEKFAAYSRKKRALKQSNNHKYYSVDEVLEVYGTKCHICQEEIDLSAPRLTGVEGWQYSLHIDHLIPISKGGDDNIDNVRPAHAICNLQKGDRIKDKM